ncbi:MAG: iron-containing alcohol dehydrogenase [Opitutaceae bacterium]|nr:iron-containing alcohol dehydrogenase [Opitutaceae bacterium]
MSGVKPAPPGGSLPERIRTPVLSARFEFATAQRILFGAGTRADLPALVAALGRRVFFVGGSNPRRQAEVLTALESVVEAVEVFGVTGEPTVALVEAGVRQARAAGSTVVVAVGGGSAIDAAKAIAALATNPGEALDYLEVVGRGRALSTDPLPFVAVPTTAGTGAEVTRNAVLSVPASRVKVSLRSAAMLPRLALVDPELALGLPAAETAATGLDALTQLIEPYLSCRANPVTDALCRDGIRRVARALPRAVREPGDLAARSDLALGALYSGMALANAGLGAVHGFAAPIGGLYPAPHGAVCAALLAPVLRANLAALRARAPQHPALGRMAEVARWLTGDPAAGADEAAVCCAALCRSLAIPPLGAWGVRAADVALIVEKAAAASSMKGNPLPLTVAELTSALEAAL